MNQQKRQLTGLVSSQQPRRTQPLKSKQREPPPTTYNNPTYPHSPPVKPKPHALRKQVFLTDTQTSDYTKSSGQMRILKIEHLQSALRSLEKENQQLKQTVINLKANQFYQLNQEKLKELIRENERLKTEIGEGRKEIQQLLIQRDFLKRFSKNLKAQCSALMKQNLLLKNPHLAHSQQSNPPSNSNSNIRIEKLATNSSSQDIHSFSRRSSSAQFMLINKKSYKIYDSEQTKIKKLKQSNQNSVNSPPKGSIVGTGLGNSGKNELSALNSDYFHGSFNVDSRSKIIRQSLT